MGDDIEGYGALTARYYDHVYAPMREHLGEAGFYGGLAREAGGPALELGCGTGRILLPLAREGIPCTGIDPSPAMLDALRRKNPPPGLRLVRARMQDFDLDGDRFALIFSAFRAFQHLITVDDQLACLARVRGHLAPGGCFAFDVFAPRLDWIAPAEEPEQEDARFTVGGDEIVRYASVRRDVPAQTMLVRMRYERRREGRVLESAHEDFRMRWFHRHELEHLLARAGFARVEIFGGFDRRPYDLVSGETVILAR